MGKLKLMAFSALVVCTMQAHAQYGYYRDALRYSQTNWLVGSTARMQGLAGAQVSLGGDVSLATSNPAGLGFFNKSSTAFTLGLGFQNSDDEFADLTTSNFKNTFNISNASMVMNFNKGRFSEEKFKGGSLGISLARINDFSRDFRYEGETGSSILDPILLNLNTGNSGALEDAFYDQFLVDEASAFNESGGVITPTGSLGNWDSPILTTPYQKELVSERGNQYQINISWGGNYDDRIYFGGGLGIQTLYYNRTRSYTEDEFLDDQGFLDPYLNSIKLDDQMVARGGGVNTSFGLIIRPVDIFTIGISYQSPTFLTINEESDFTLSTDWEDYGYAFDGDVYNLIDVNPTLSDITETKYNIRTPSRINVGGTVFLGKSGFISGDIERVDYSNVQLKSSDFSPLLDNQVILNEFKSVMNYRIGAEYRLDNIRLRGGYAVYPNPAEVEKDRDFVTFGVGYKSSDFYIDLAVVNSSYQQVYQPYAYGSVDTTVQSDIRNTQLTITTGFNF